ncbi:hypothetical protein [Fervidobacterium sp. 2310opik-2]|uniref:hypothetical protein n=1 Tax=Fervidobacterium sp. 2310opik-2 TaxID=1755815 RepID=UPI0013DF116B|nr:hypothetical protein [Fervidobacterium sp. 2310opik-2]KAF2962349.1 hypothetical protein AS161_05285 [Fervidobacterium sp. 2310opik-2]
MKKALFITSAVILILVVASCASLEKPLLLKSVTVDATLTDWGEYLYTDGASDSKWENNEIYQAGILFDATNLYIAGIFTKDGYNNFMVMVDLSGVAGASDTNKHPWERSYKFEEGDVDFVLETWGDDYTAWIFTTSEASEVKGTFAKATKDGKNVVEFAIPLSKLGVTDASKLSVKAVFVITGGTDDQGKQWAGDFYPDQGFETEDGGYTAPIVIKKVVTIPTQE